MSKMGEAVHRRVDAIRARHEKLKERKFGYLVRPLTILIGWLVVIAGVITIPFPGPGWFMVFVGIGILSLELEWPGKLLDWAIRQYDQFEVWWDRQTLAVKGMLGALLILLILVVFLILFVLGWNWGMLDWTKSGLQPWIEKVPNDIPERIGLKL